MNDPLGPVSYLEFSFFRSLVLAITSYALLQSYQIKTDDFPPDCKVPLVIRCLVGTFTFVITTVSLKILPLSVYTIVTNTSPFMTTVLQYLWIRERI